MPYHNFREYVERLKETGDLVVVDRQVSTDMEMSVITRRNCQRQGPAQLFTDIKGYPGWDVVMTPIGTWRRYAISLEMDPDSHFNEIMAEYNKRKENPIKPVLVKNAPCQENVITGDNIDLFSFPVPSEGHAGLDSRQARNIGTWNSAICKDPDSGWVNYGNYRSMILDKTSTTVFTSPAQHIGMMYYEKYKPAGKPMPFAIAIGGSPLTGLIASTSLPAGVSEPDIIGALQKEPLELVKCTSIDLEVPANSEIILEGELSVDEPLADEGPSTNYAGYRSKLFFKHPVFKVKTITHRNNPLFISSILGLPVCESTIVAGMGMSSEYLRILKENGLPVTSVYVPPEGGLHIVVVATKTPYPNIASRIGATILGHKMGALSTKVVVVNDDIDITNLNEWFHAFCTRLDPAEDIAVNKHAFNYPYGTSYLGPEQRVSGDGSNVVFDATIPHSWKPEETPYRHSWDNPNIYTPEVIEKVRNNWDKYGFEK
ncbi:UbiD family decarboxylase [Desulfobacula toluolica]|uniref:UbiD6: 3-octaprenyl-4-hydroxybenzoate carboxy-lyase n=1 Tax=Desulfobacula toluolica (strain DSM 7467 / Tol2) TaxID=651182 RepID=K0NQ97_DESTT|nr:UbiD family decarboxylase [Desulfobacula toluolica]CCK82338.1 UbiD6: 3-octaprenyl-4-hydroxybenzoate carboxy-lyase [Desulfobacula toluolica Tol2]